MSIRHIVDAAIKILGIYYAVRALSQLAVVIGVAVTPPMGDFRVMALWSNASILAGLIVAAIALLAGGRAIATWVAPDDARLPTAGGRRDWLYVGLVLVGAWFLVAAVPDVVRYIVTLFYYSGAPRQAVVQRVAPGALLEMVVRSGIDALGGLAVIIWARPIAAFLDRRAEPAGEQSDNSNAWE